MSSVGKAEKGNSAVNIDNLLESALQDFDNVPKKAKKAKAKSEPAVDQDLIKMLERVGFPTPDSGDLSAELLNLPGDNQQPPAGTTSLQEALKKMSTDSEKLKDIPSEEELNKMFEGLQGDHLEEGLNNLLPMMEGMMQSLLSKDLLYPAMKDMNEKFPDWLADNRQNIGEDEYRKYNKQYDLTRAICHEFEKEDSSLGEDDKKKRFERVMALMQVII